MSKQSHDCSFLKNKITPGPGFEPGNPQGKRDLCYSAFADNSSLFDS